MHIKNLEGLSPAQLKREIDHGGKFVIFDYTMICCHHDLSSVERYLFCKK